MGKVNLLLFLFCYIILLSQAEDTPKVTTPQQIVSTTVKPDITKDKTTTPTPGINVTQIVPEKSNSSETDSDNSTVSPPVTSSDMGKENETTTANTTTAKPTVAPTTAATTTLPTKPSTSIPTTTKPTTTQPTKPSSTSTSTLPTKPSDATTTAQLPTSAPSKDRRFDGASFIGGIVLSIGMMAIAFVAVKFYRARTERNYHTL